MSVVICDTSIAERVKEEVYKMPVAQGKKDKKPSWRWRDGIVGT